MLAFIHIPRAPSILQPKPHQLSSARSSAQLLPIVLGAASASAVLSVVHRRARPAFGVRRVSLWSTAFWGRKMQGPFWSITWLEHNDKTASIDTQIATKCVLCFRTWERTPPQLVFGTSCGVLQGGWQWGSH